MSLNGAMAGSVRVGGAAVAFLIAICAAAQPVAAFQSADRCFTYPVLAPPIHYRIAEFTRMLRNPHAPTRAQACMLFARGLLQHFDGDPQSAIDDYTHALGWMHDPTAIYEMRGDAYEDAGEHDKALADYAEAAKGKPEAETLTNLCWVRAVRGHPLTRALTECDEAIRLKPEKNNGREARCVVLYRLGRYAEAILDCDAVLKEKPESAGALYFRGLAKRHAGQEDAAKQDMAAAIRISPRTADVLGSWGIKE